MYRTTISNLVTVVKQWLKMKRTRPNENGSFKLFLRVNETFRHDIKESQVKVDKLWII